MPSATTDIAIIGAGIVGSCCAWQLVRMGQTVTFIDPEPPGSMTSYGNAGAISPDMVAPFSIPGMIYRLPGWLLRDDGPLKIQWRSLPQLLPWLRVFFRHANLDSARQLAGAQHALMRQVTTDHLAISEATDQSHLLARNGAWAIYGNERNYLKDRLSRQLQDELGISASRIDRSAALNMEPDLHLPGDALVLDLPDWMHVRDPGAYSGGIAAAAVQAGATRMEDRVEDIRIRPDGQFQLQMKSGRTLRARKLLIAAGVWSQPWVAQFDGPVPLTAKRGYHLMLNDPGVRLRRPLHISHRQFMLTPMAGGIRVAGTAEFAAADTPPDWRRADRLGGQARAFFPTIELGAACRWMGRRPMMADGLPVLGESPSQPGLYYAFGHGHWGLTQAPTTGKLLARLISHGDAGFDLSPYSVERFIR